MYLKKVFLNTISYTEHIYNQLATIFFDYLAINMYCALVQYTKGLYFCYVNHIYFIPCFYS